MKKDIERDKAMEVEIQRILIKIPELEQELLITFGQKFHFNARVEDRRGEPILILEQESIITGTALGILGAAISNVDVDLEVRPIWDTDGLHWFGRIHLRWEHPDGGSNGHEIGTIRYDNDQFGRDFRNPGKFTVRRG